MTSPRSLVLSLAIALAATVAAPQGHGQARKAQSVFVPAVAEWQFLSSSTVPPTEAQCFAAGRRCFSPQTVQAAYNFGPLYGQGINGRGITIAVIDSFGSPSIASDLHVFNQAFGLQPMCGETGVICAPGMPTFSVLSVQGSPSLNPPPPSDGTGIEAHNLWALEVSLDVQWAHAIAPQANIVLVTTPTAEILGVQGFPQMMSALQYVIDNHLADVVSMSLGAAEGTFHNGTAALEQMRDVLLSAQANHVTVLASTGDNGTANFYKEPVKNPAEIPYPSVNWPASDPLVTAVGGTYLCTDPANVNSRTVDSVDPPAKCRAFPGVAEVGWTFAGGGYSILFPRPAFQSTLPAGSSFVGSSAGAPPPNFNMRGIPDVAYQASAGTGILVYSTVPFTSTSGPGCGGASPCSIGWYVVGGTSIGAPQWAGLVALADQVAGGRLGHINPALYAIGADPSKYANDFFDITTGKNQADPAIPGYPATTGWDAVTGLGTPNAANLVPDLVQAVLGH